MNNLYVSKGLFKLNNNLIQNICKSVPFAWDYCSSFSFVVDSRFSVVHASVSAELLCNSSVIQLRINIDIQK